jgi:hypothetical protein
MPSLVYIGQTEESLNIVLNTDNLQEFRQTFNLTLPKIRAAVKILSRKTSSTLGNPIQLTGGEITAILRNAL